MRPVNMKKILSSIDKRQRDAARFKPLQPSTGQNRKGIIICTMIFFKYNLSHEQKSSNMATEHNDRNLFLKLYMKRFATSHGEVE